ncbi:6-bladed beta-propeller [Capnocytophaga sp. oral taxon 878]|uniref:6-bladed beta-propeller n=1 Tax=Capnocytophaga sp. oral taxon 878 TaxID=1316596 RepID=UPI00101AE0D3|nr:6-bladed beta-propeller [Capnocytophaga sp. oral taxon 878]
MKLFFMHRYFTYIIVFLFLVACDNNTPEEVRFTEQQIESLHLSGTQVLEPQTDSIIHINLTPFLGKREFDFGNIVKEVKIVPLETTKNSLLDGIYKVITTDEYIYIMDNFKGKSLIIFTKEGKFIKRLSHGQGPGELQRLYDIDYDFQTNELIAYQHSFFLFFDKEGNFLRQERLPINFDNFISLDNGYILRTAPVQGNTHLDDKEGYTFLFTDKIFTLKSVAVYQPKDIKAMSAHTYLYKNDSLITLAGRYSDSIYKYDAKKNKLYTEFVLDYDKKLPKKYLYGENFRVFQEVTKNNDYYFNIGEYFETFSQNVFFLWNNYINLQTIVYRDKKTGNMIGGTSAMLNLEEVPAFNFPIGVDKNYFVSVYNPYINRYEKLKNSKLISEADKEKIKQFKDDDNPMLVYFTLKEF